MHFPIYHTNFKSVSKGFVCEKARRTWMCYKEYKDVVSVECSAKQITARITMKLLENLLFQRDLQRQIFFLNIIVINFSQSRNYFSSSSSPREVQRDSLIYLVVFFLFALNFLKDSELDENPEDVEATTHFGAPGMGR